MAIIQLPAAPMIFIGLAADTKPIVPANNAPNTALKSLIPAVPNGAMFIATDTPAYYIFDAASQSWVTGSPAMA